MVGLRRGRTRAGRAAPASRVATPKPSRLSPAPGPVTVDGATAVDSPVTRAAADTAISSPPSGRSVGLSSTVASGKKCTPTPKQTSTGAHR